MIPDELRGQVSSVRIVVLAFACGAWMFPLVIFFLVTPVAGASPGAVTFVAAVASVMSVGMGFVLPGVIVSQGRAQIRRGGFHASGTPSEREAVDRAGDAGRLLNLFRGATIMGAAVIEFGSLFSTVAYLVEGSRWMLVPAFVLPLLILLFRLPSDRAVSDWLEQQQRLLSRERG